MKKKIIKFFLIIFCAFFGINNVNALKCEYEMYPINIGSSSGCTDESGNKILCTHIFGDGKTKAKIEVNINSKKNYTISEKSNFGGNRKTYEISDKNFVKKTLKKGNCPNYIRRDTWGLNKADDNLHIYKDDGGDFLKDLDTMYDTTSTKRYVAVLVKQDDKVVKDGYETVLKYATTSWNNFASQDSYKKNAELKKESLERENNFIEGVKTSSVYSSIEKSDTWTTYIKNKNKRHQTEADEQTLETAKNDYCYFYCEKVACKSYAGNANALTECKKNCETTDKVKCQESSTECANAEDMDACMRDALTNKGLDGTYVDERNKSLTDLQTNINESRGKITVTGLKKLNLKYGTYNIKCEDVSDLHQYWVAIKILAPILVILFGSGDLLISIISGDEEKIKKARNKFPKRLIAALLIFLASTIISIIVGLSSNADVKNTKLLDCILNGE